MDPRDAGDLAGQYNNNMTEQVAAKIQARISERIVAGGKVDGALASNNLTVYGGAAAGAEAWTESLRSIREPLRNAEKSKIHRLHNMLMVVTDTEVAKAALPVLKAVN